VSFFDRPIFLNPKYVIKRLFHKGLQGSLASTYRVWLSEVIKCGVRYQTKSNVKNATENFNKKF
jgi:hypothetical protein